MDAKLIEVKNESHSKTGIFDMNVFLYRLNFIFKCLGIKHSKFIGYKIQTIIILGLLLDQFNWFMLHIFEWNNVNWGLYEVFRCIY